MAGQKSLVNIFWARMTLVYLSMVCLLAYFWVGQELKSHRDEFNQVRKTYISARKDAMKAHVSQAVHYIVHEKSQAGQRVRQDIESRTQAAWETAARIWQTNREDLPREKIEALIRDALFPGTWDQGRTCYFAQRLPGTDEFERPSGSGSGNALPTALVRVARSPAGEGFSTYQRHVPGTPDDATPGIAYVKYFAPLNWIIGIGRSVIDEEEAIKAEVLAYLDSFTFGADHYFFAGTFEGLSLAGPFKGENRRNAKDAAGVEIIPEFVQAARAGGGFIECLVPKRAGQIPRKKIIYTRAIEGWDWYVGTGMYMDAVEDLILEKQAQLRQATNVLILKTVSGLAVCLLASFGLAWALSRKIRKNLALFSALFKTSATRHHPMADDQISFSEFVPLARSASRMLVERNKYEDALARSEEKYRRLFEYSKDALLIIENEIFVDCNQATVEMLGYSEKSQLLQTHPSDLSPPVQPDGRDSFSKAVEMMQAAVRNGSHRFEWHHLRASGEVFPVEVLLTAMSTGQGRQIIHTTWRDITDRKKTQEMMIQTEKMITVGGLAAGMAHEINNPLAGMMQSAQVVKHRLSGALPANEKAAADAGLPMEAMERYVENRGIAYFLDTIIETGTRAAKIIQNMLNFVRKESNEKSVHDIAAILDLAIALAVNDYSLKKNYDIRKINIVKHYAPDTPWILCDASNIQQVFFNLIKNAAQAMATAAEPGRVPRIDLFVEPENRGVCIRIRDNGPGMDAAVAKRIFEPFYTTRAVDQGTGLGLSVSYFIIVQDHGGRLEVTTAPGKGTCFFIRLPGSAENPEKT